MRAAKQPTAHATLSPFVSREERASALGAGKRQAHLKLATAMARKAMAKPAGRANRMGSPCGLRSLGWLGVARPYQTPGLARQTGSYDAEVALHGSSERRLKAKSGRARSSASQGFQPFCWEPPLLESWAVG